MYSVRAGAAPLHRPAGSLRLLPPGARPLACAGTGSRGTRPRRRCGAAGARGGSPGPAARAARRTQRDASEGDASRGAAPWRAWRAPRKEARLDLQHARLQLRLQQAVLRPRRPRRGRVHAQHALQARGHELGCVCAWPCACGVASFWYGRMARASTRVRACAGAGSRMRVRASMRTAAARVVVNVRDGQRAAVKLLTVAEARRPPLARAEEAHRAPRRAARGCVAPGLGVAGAAARSGRAWTCLEPPAPAAATLTAQARAVRHSRVRRPLVGSAPSTNPCCTFSAALVHRAAGRSWGE